MRLLFKATSVFLVTVLVFGPLVDFLRAKDSWWVLALLVGGFVLLYDLVERKLARGKSSQE